MEWLQLQKEKVQQVTDRKAKVPMDKQSGQRRQKTATDRNMARLALDREIWVRKNIEPGA